MFGARSVFPGVGGGELCGLGLWGHAGVTLDHRRAADGSLDLQSVCFCHICVVTALCLSLSVTLLPLAFVTFVLSLLSVSLSVFLSFSLFRFSPRFCHICVVTALCLSLSVFFSLLLFSPSLLSHLCCHCSLSLSLFFRLSLRFSSPLAFVTFVLSPLSVSLSLSLFFSVSPPPPLPFVVVLVPPFFPASFPSHLVSFPSIFSLS